jgi:hypothetical protein
MPGVVPEGVAGTQLYSRFYLPQRAVFRIILNGGLAVLSDLTAPNNRARAGRTTRTPVRTAVTAP